MISINLQGHLAVVTGGAGQIGRTICTTLAKAGCNVAVHYYQNRSRAQELAHRLKTEYGVLSEAFPADVSKLVSVCAMKKQVAALLGNPDIIVNGAVVQYDWKPLLEQDTADFVMPMLLAMSFTHVSPSEIVHIIFILDSSPTTLKKAAARGISSLCILFIFISLFRNTISFLHQVPCFLLLPKGCDRRYPFYR